MKISGHIFKALVGLFFLLVIQAQVYAEEFAGVTIKPQVSVAGIDNPLQLNGAGIRHKFFFKIYVGALYLPQPQKDAESILKASQANQVMMHFVYDEVEKEKLVNGWLEGFENNVEKSVFKKLESRLQKFNQMFVTLHEGDVVLLDYLPGKGTRVTIKGEEKGVIEGADFNQALLSVWLGDDPVTEELKEALLGL